MTHHLDDASFAAALSGSTVDPAIRDHLESCLVCRRELQVHADLLEAENRRQRLQAPDWNAQRASILEQLPATTPVVSIAPTRRRWMRRLMAAAATGLVAIGIGWIAHDLNRPTPSDPVPVEDILATTDRLLAEDGVPGFDAIDPYSEQEIDYGLLLDNQNS